MSGSYTTGTDNFDMDYALNAIKGLFNPFGGFNMTGGDGESTTTTAAETSMTSTIIQSIVSILQFMMMCFAIFLSIQCNQGFNFGSFLMACCCSPCYIAYRLALGTKGCLL